MKRFLVAIVLGIVILQLTACQRGNIRSSDKEGLASVYYHMGVQYMHQDNLEVALEKFNKALEADVTFSPAHNGIATLYRRLGDDANAELHYRKAISYDPKDSASLNNYGGFLCDQERFPEAEAKYVAAASNPLYRSPAEALTNAGICASRIPDMEKAESYYRQALQKNGRYPMALLHMSDLSLGKQNYMSARGYMQRYLEVAEQNADSLWIAARIEYALGDRNASSSYAMALKNRYPGTEQTRLLMEWENEQRTRP